MSYTLVDTSVPGGDTLGDAWGKVNAGFVDTIREIVFGAVPGWNYSKTGADPTAPETELWTNGTNVLRIAYTYSTGLVATAVYSYSTNGGSSFTTKATVTYTYDGDGYLISTTWS